MSCDRVRELLAENLSWNQDEEVLHHLENCGECAEFCRDLRALEELTADLKEELLPPPQFQDEVLSRLAQSQTVFGFRRIPVLLGIIVLVVGGFYWQTSPNRAEGNQGSLATASEERSVIEEDQNDLHFVDVIVDDESAQGEYILRLPSVIEIKHSDLHEEVYVSDVSH